ncbi:peptidylprolyl isomerase [Caldimonas aquatica]|uniref:peptidylprolyl isomerase n=1 Tax=Caldimonas aquatica TaxID=376175 RepID=A0ABY6MQ64_9BURK|nr:peptidylprolyl isomerase [Schlegelella aquatica]UZD53643.1 peptidylprolyl isomerase [Schlegelella aquatica]
MKKTSRLALGTLSLAVSAALWLPLGAAAQNIAVVNGKPVPKERAEALMNQVVRQGQPVTPDLERQVKDEVVMREIFMQEAERRGLAQSQNYKQQMELARQAILIRELFADFQKKNPVTDAEVQAEYDKFKASAGGKEYRARHILVEKEDEAKKLIAQLKGGAKFEDLAKKNSKDPGSAANGGDLDWATPDSYVPEFSQAMVGLQKGQITDVPVKSQFGYHVIKLEDVREVKLPALDEVKPQIQQSLAQQKLAKFRDQLRDSAKTDYKFQQ